MLNIKNLKVAIDDKVILENFSLDINDGDVVALMGPNGIGKSTICKVIMGDPTYKVLSGSIIYNGEDLLKMDTTTRSRKGLYLVNQNPIEIEGVTNADMLRTALECRTGNHTNFFEFNKKVTEICKKLNIPAFFIHRGVNVGMSGGEKKKNEILQMLVLNPKLAILDETDSGLDVDAIKTVSKGISMFKNDDNAVLIITHNTKILHSLKVDYVHILVNGKIVKTGNAELAREIEENGYSQYK